MPQTGLVTGKRGADKEIRSHMVKMLFIIIFYCQSYPALGDYYHFFEKCSK